MSAEFEHRHVSGPCHDACVPCVLPKTEVQRGLDGDGDRDRDRESIAGGAMTIQKNSQTTHDLA